MIDEARLSKALREAARDFEVPDRGVEMILARGMPEWSSGLESDSRDETPPRFRVRRALAVAAAMVALAGGVTLSVTSLSDGNSPNPPSAAPARPYGEGGSAASSAQVPTDYGRSASTSSGGATPSATVPPKNPSSAIAGQSAKVKANGSVDLTIPGGSLQTVLGKLTALATTEGGFVANTEAQYGNRQRMNPATGEIILRVPESNFGATVTQVQLLGKTTSVNTTSQDVTGQYVDLQSMISALEASRQQYLTIMTKATTIGGILAVQDQLNSIESQIQQLQGQLNVLNNETAYGTLTVLLQEPGQKAKPVKSTMSSGVGKAWHSSISGVVSGFEWLIRIAGPTLFVLILLAALGLVGFRVWRFTRRRMI
jgi:Domain of unknown function (DUF4349)